MPCRSSRSAAGEYLVDNVEVIPLGGANVISNPDFESGLAGWCRRAITRTRALSRAGATKPVGACTSGPPPTVTRAQPDSHHLDGAAERRPDRHDPRPRPVALRRPEILFRLKGNWLERPATS